MKRDRKGFTMAELLIVVAIIAVLVAVAIPVFSQQLERSREATDMANIRSAYAAAEMALLTGMVGDEEIVADTAYYVTSAGELYKAGDTNRAFKLKGTATVGDSKNDKVYMLKDNLIYNRAENYKDGTLQVRFVNDPNGNADFSEADLVTDYKLVDNSGNEFPSDGQNIQDPTDPGETGGTDGD